MLGFTDFVLVAEDGRILTTESGEPFLLRREPTRARVVQPMAGTAGVNTVPFTGEWTRLQRARARRKREAEMLVLMH